MWYITITIIIATTVGVTVSVTITAATTTAKTYSITGGDGADKLIVDGGGTGADLDLSVGTSAITLSGIETLYFNEDTGNNLLLQLEEFLPSAT